MSSGRMSFFCTDISFSSWHVANTLAFLVRARVTRTTGVAIAEFFPPFLVLLDLLSEGGGSSMTIFPVITGEEGCFSSVIFSDITVEGGGSSMVIFPDITGEEGGSSMVIFSVSTGEDDMLGGFCRRERCLVAAGVKEGKVGIGDELCL